MMPLSIAKRAAAEEVTWMRWALRILVGVYVAFNAGHTIESSYFPVLKDVAITDVKLANGKLCFTLTLTKTKNAKRLFYIAQVYNGDNPAYHIQNLDHADGEPYGGSYQGAPPGRYATPTCIEMAHGAENEYRIGVRILARFEVPMRPWAVDQPEIWIDAYKGANY
jgi:hypothetical protein